MEEKKVPELLKDSAILLAIVTAFIYIFSYIYIKGFLSFYNIPTDLNIDWSFFMLTKYCVDIIKLFSSLFVQCALGCFFILIFFHENIKEIYLMTFSFLFTAFIFKILSLYINNKIFSKSLEIFGIVIILIITIMIPVLFYNYQKQNKKWKIFSEFLNSSTFKIVTYGLISVLIILCGKIVYETSVEIARNKNDYIYYEEKSSVLIFQDSSKSIFLKINEKGESEGKFFTVSDSDFELSTYKSKILINE